MLQELINNRYRIEKQIGEGGMGQVYKAYDRLGKTMVALKRVTIPQSEGNSITSSSDISPEKMVMANEFSTLASLRHPNIISVLDYGFDDAGNPFFAMDLLEDGIQILDYVAGISQDQKISYLLDILQALRYLHQRGILHRDLKPANILVANDSLKLLDFGLAIDLEYAQTHGSTAGTLAYLAPEVLRGHSPSAGSDLYAFAVISHEIFTGKHPFPFRTQSELIQQVLLESPKFQVDNLDKSLELVLSRLLSKNVDERYETALDTIKALCMATDYPLPEETIEIRESFLMASTFVGRENELRTLRDALERTLDNVTSNYLIAGESGVGKTRLMDELRTSALVRGVRVIRGQAVTEAGLPYKIWRDILPELILITDISDDEASILKTLVPDIGDFLERDIQSTSLSEDAINTRLPLIVNNLIVSATQHTPILIMLEDLQWASDSIAILKTVVSSNQHIPLMIIGNYRIDESPQLVDTLSSMRHLNLERLSAKNIKQLSSAMLGVRGEESSVIELIQRESEGNAFFIIEVVRALAEEVGELSNIGLSTLPAQVFAGGIQQVIQRKLAKLPGWTLYPVQVSSIIGRQISPNLLKLILSDLNIEQWLRVCGKIALFSVTGEQWQFTHDKIREYIISNMEAEQTKAINQLIAETIESHHADNLERFTPALTEYYRAAGNKQKEGYYATQAADFLRVFDPPSAYRLVKRAIALEAYLHHEEPGREQARVYLLLGQTALSISEYDEARKALDTALSGYEAINEEYGIAKVKNHLGEWGFKTSKFEGAIDLLKESLPVLERLEDWYEVGSVYMNISIIYARQGELEIALPYFQKCLDTLLLTGDEVSIAKAYNNLAIAREMTGDIDAGLKFHQKALDIRRRLKDKNGLATSLQNLASIENDKGNFEKSREMRLEALGYAREITNRRAEVNILIGLGMTLKHLGNEEKAISYVQKAVHIARQIDDRFMQGDAYIRLGHLHLENHPEEALSNFYKAATIAKDFDIIPTKIEVIEHLSFLAGESANFDAKTQVLWLSSTLAYKKNYEHFDRIDAMLTQLQSELSEADYQSAMNDGKSLSLDDILEQILEIRGSNHVE